MTYVMSDIHGTYEKYIKMLEKIDFSEKDVLFVLGDVCDRGANPVEVLLDMMYRPNVFPILGNHDATALYFLQKMSVDITDENFGSQLSAQDISAIMDWIDDGGSTTVAGFQKLPPEERQEILDYLSEWPAYECVDVAHKTFVLVHAGLGNFRKDKKLSEYSLEELLLTRQSPDVRYFDDDDVYLITGHTPTHFISGKDEIYQNCHNICIDCGACFDGGRLACLRLDDMQEFYT